MDKNVRGIKLHLRRKTDKERAKQVIDRCFKRIDYILSPEGRKEANEKRELSRKREAFNFREFVKNIYGRR